MPARKSANRTARKVTVLGGGPAGLYFALLLKKADAAAEVTVLERNPANVTYGWGVVFSDRTLSSFQRADYKTYTQITEQFVIWDAIDVRYRGETIRCGGHVIAAIERRRLLNILQERCAELGVEVRFGVDVTDLGELPECDLLVAADGVNSTVRRAYEEAFRPSMEMGNARFIWLGADKVLDAFNFIFHETEHGLFQVHAYPFSGTTSTFIVECAEDVWQRTGLDQADEAASVAFCQGLLNDDLGGQPLLSNNSKWISFPTLKTRKWHTVAEGRHVVLLGDSAHTAHFSIGSGTKLAMEDAIALAEMMERHPDVETALNEYELERKPVVETFQRAAQESRTYFETLKRYLVLPPVQFAFQLLTRSGRISYDDLHFRDVRFGDMVDSWFASHARCDTAGFGHEGEGLRVTAARAPRFAPAPMFAPCHLRGVTLPSRTAALLPVGAVGGAPARSLEDFGLVLTEILAISPDGRITPDDAGIYAEEQRSALAAFVADVRVGSQAKVGVQIGHAGRRGATRPRAQGLDRPLKEGAWPLIAASALPYTPVSEVPAGMTREDMDRVRDEFVRAAQRALEAGADLLQLHMAQGYLLAGFLSPLANVREDDYGGDPYNRARFPLEVFDAVREVWPEDMPLSVALSATDYVRGGMDVEDAVVFARLLKAHGCDLMQVLAGQTTPTGEPPYSRGFLTPLSDRIRNEAGIPTMVGGYLITSNDANTILAAGKADVCLMAT